MRFCFGRSSHGRSSRVRAKKGGEGCPRYGIARTPLPVLNIIRFECVLIIHARLLALSELTTRECYYIK